MTDDLAPDQLGAQTESIETLLASLTEKVSEAIDVYATVALHSGRGESGVITPELDEAMLELATAQFKVLEQLRAIRETG